MIFNYNSFVSDLILESINESHIYYVEDFKRLLKRLNNNIARDLLSVEKTDVNPDMTFIGLSNKEGNVSFSQMDKVLNMISSSLSDRFNELSLKNFLDRIRTGKISDNDSYYYFNYIKDKSRNDVKLGKLVNKIFPGKYSEKEVESFVNLVKSRISGTTKEMVLVEGEEIREWYDEHMYEEITGDLGNSCMRYSNCSEYLDIYVYNPDVCRLLICKHFDKIVGRALIWKLHEVNIDPKPEFFMDRIYTTDDSIKILFTDYADQNGWLKRASSTHYECRKFKLGEDTYEDEFLSIKLENFKFDKYPYMDTFKVLNISTGELINDDEEDDCGEGYLLTNTDGSFTDLSNVYSDYYDQYIPRDESVFSYFYGTYIWKNLSVLVKLGKDGNTGYYPKDSEFIKFDIFRDEYINCDDVIFSALDNCYFYKEDETYVMTKIYYEESSLRKVSKDYSLTSNMSNDLVIIEDLDCFNYLDNKTTIRYIHRSIVSKDTDNPGFYITELSVELYETKDGYFSEEDCFILGLKKGEKSHTTDLLAYNYSLGNNIGSKNLIKKYDNLIKDMEDSVESSVKLYKFIKMKERLLKRQKELLRWSN